MSMKIGMLNLEAAVEYGFDNGGLAVRRRTDEIVKDE